MPFANAEERDLHFKKHGHKFNAPNAIAYEQMADAFMFGPRTLTTREDFRANLIDRLRYNFANRHFGVASIAPEFVRTFYPVPLHTVNHHGGSAAYFAYECARTDI